MCSFESLFTFLSTGELKQQLLSNVIGDNFFFFFFSSSERTVLRLFGSGAERVCLGNFGAVIGAKTGGPLLTPERSMRKMRRCRALTKGGGRRLT